MRYTTGVMEPFIPTFKREPGVYQGTPQTPLEKSEGPPSPQLIRTMKIDVAEAIKKQNETFVSIALAEERKQLQKRGEALAAQANTTPHAPKPRGRMVIIGILLLIVITLGFTYVFVLPRITTVQTSGISTADLVPPSSDGNTLVNHATIPLASALIPPQYEKRFTLNKETPDHLFATIAVERTAGVIPGAINNLYFTEEAPSADGTSVSAVISANRLLTFANIYAPDILIRSLEAPFMAGLLGETRSSATPFLILKVSSYDTGLAGMLAWEASLPRLFDTVFGTKFQAMGASGVKFRDLIVLGKDARMFNTASGVALAYSFANPNTIVIAGSQSALEILLPLVAK